MEERDYLLRQINSIARALGKFLADLQNYQREISIDKIKLLDRILNQHLNINLATLLLLDEDLLITLLVKDNNLDNHSLENLVNIHMDLNSDTHYNYKEFIQVHLPKTCLLILNFININSKNYSIDGNHKILILKNIISKI